MKRGKLLKLSNLQQSLEEDLTLKYEENVIICSLNTENVGVGGEWASTIKGNSKEKYK